MASAIYTGTSARRHLRESLTTSVRAVGAAMGPAGRGLVYEIGGTQAAFAHGGAEIARRVAGEQGERTVASRLLSEALDHARRDLGDGSARLACIAGAIYQSALTRVEAGVHPGTLASAILTVSSQGPGLLMQQRCETAPPESVARSAGADADLASTLARIGPQLSAPGAVDIREGWRPGVEIFEHRGFCFDIQTAVVGLESREQGIRVEIEQVHLLVVNEILVDFGSLAPVLEKFSLHGKALCIVARGFAGAAAATLVANRAALRTHLIGLIPEAVGNRAYETLEDVCIATGATLIGAETGTSMASVTPSHLGLASKLIAERGRCLLTGGGGNARDIRSKQSALYEEARTNQYLELDRDRALKRAARLDGYWAEFFIAGRTTAETARHLNAARSAVAALHAAASGGVVAGAGAALAAISTKWSAEGLQGRYSLGVQAACLTVLRDGCMAVQQQLIHNAGASLGTSFGEHVVDPLTTTISILQRAVSMAATMLTIEVLVC